MGRAVEARQARTSSGPGSEDSIGVVSEGGYPLIRMSG
ncbi:hypothetical protein DB32_007535 [Sandaracinus amylolyticus]|uniref:Uncharacterized protein n=1 Tax=Sandaracinus amylolyticus TaxID=927083 RepID=A0A0F6W8W1_9BACT|nr:hypothetical protein DB32_007535 [Sandaracinus amylolyticus]